MKTVTWYYSTQKHAVFETDKLIKFRNNAVL